VEKAWRRPGGKSRCQRKWQRISEVTPVNTMGVGLPSAPTSWDSTEGCSHLRSVNTERHFRQRASRITRLGRWRSWAPAVETPLERLARIMADAKAGAVRGQRISYPLPALEQPGNCILAALVNVGAISKGLAEEYASAVPLGRDCLERRYETVFEDLSIGWSHMSEALPAPGTGLWLWNRPQGSGRSHCVVLWCRWTSYEVFDVPFLSDIRWNGLGRGVTISEQRLRASLLHQDPEGPPSSWFLKVYKDNGCACSSATCEECVARAWPVSEPSVLPGSAGAPACTPIDGKMEAVPVELPVMEWECVCAPGDMRTKKQFPRQVVEWLANKGKLKPNPKGGADYVWSNGKTKMICKLGQP